MSLLKYTGKSNNFNMIGKSRYISSPLILLLIFLAPLIIKNWDSLSHHHEQIRYTIDGRSYIRANHEICLIFNYKFFLFTQSRIISETQVFLYFDELIINYISDFYCNISSHSLLLRSPPYIS